MAFTFLFTQFVSFLCGELYCYLLLVLFLVHFNAIAGYTNCVYATNYFVRALTYSFISQQLSLRNIESIEIFFVPPPTPTPHHRHHLFLLVSILLVLHHHLVLAFVQLFEHPQLECDFTSCYQNTQYTRCIHIYFIFFH